MVAPLASYKGARTIHTLITYAGPLNCVSQVTLSILSMREKFLVHHAKFCRMGNGSYVLTEEKPVSYLGWESEDSSSSCTDS